MCMALMSPRDAAARLLISVKTLIGHVHDGSIRYVNVGRSDRRPRYAFSDTDLSEFEANRSRKNVGAGATQQCQSTGRPVLPVRLSMARSSLSRHYEANEPPRSRARRARRT